MTKRKKDNPEKRQEFIDTALSLFSKKGVEHTSLRDIIRAANNGRGVSPSVFYYYFDSKEDLIRACLQTARQSYTADLKQLLASDLPLSELITAVFSRIRETFQQESTLFTTTTARREMLGTEDTLIFLSSLIEQVSPYIAQVIDKALGTGELRRTPLLEAASTRDISHMLCAGLISVFHNTTLETDERMRQSQAFVTQLLQLND